MYHIKKWPRFSFSNIYIITIVKISYRPIQYPFNFQQQTSIDYFKIGICIYGKCLENSFSKTNTYQTLRAELIFQALALRK